MGKPTHVQIGSRWQSNRSPRVFVVIERLPFGRLITQEEGRAYTGEVHQKALLENFTQLLEK